MRDLNEITALPEMSDGRLRLRALRPADKPAVVVACADPVTVRFSWRIPVPYCEQDFDDFLTLTRHSWADDREAHWAVADVESDEFLAMISLDLSAANRQTGEIGYWCAPSARGRGVMSGAARLVRDWAFERLELERLELTTDQDNVASQRVAESIGYRREGIMRSYLSAHGRRTTDVLYGMTRDDPRPAAGERRSGGLGWPRLDDGRLCVRPFEPDDAPAVRAACDDADVAHWIHLLPSPYTAADAEEFVAGSRRSLAAGERARLAVCDVATGELLGSVSLDLFREREAAEIGYWIKREARRRGVALAAARLVVRWAFEEVGVERLEILVYPGNQASQALAGKLGFVREALLRGFLAPEPGKSRDGRVVPSDDGTLPARDDQVQFALLREDWAG